jgi:hypothetical protein
MAVGLHTVNLANNLLNILRGTAFPTAPPSQNVKLHTADPGSAATTAPSGTTTRQVATYSAAASAALALSNTPTWSSWAGGSETISHISVWDNVTAGNVDYSAALTVAKAVVNGDTLTLTSLSVSLAPVMA